jgi:hypothetical protein
VRWWVMDRWIWVVALVEYFLHRVMGILFFCFSFCIFRSTMAQPKLDERVTLIGGSILPVLRLVRDHVGQCPRPVVLLGREAVTDMSVDRLGDAFHALTGENMDAVLALVDREDNHVNRVIVMHITAMYANREGKAVVARRPRDEANVPKDPKRPRVDRALGGDGPSDEDILRVVDQQIEAREMSRAAAEFDMVRDKVRAVAGMEDTDVGLLIYLLEDMADRAKKCNHQDMGVFKKLAVEAERYRSRMDVSMLCLNVLGGRSDDPVGAAVAKQLVAVKKKGSVGSKQGERELPFQSVGHFPMLGMGMSNPGVDAAWLGPRLHYEPVGGPARLEQAHPAGQEQFRSAYLRPALPRDPATVRCRFCEVMGHFERECPERRKAKETMMGQKK